MNKKILITGAAGFIGFHTSQACASAGYEVIGLDNFNNYYTVELKRERARRLSLHKIPVVEGDITDKKLLFSLFEKEGFTHLIHLAAQAGVRYSEENPDAYIHSNLIGFGAILETCRAFPTCRLLFASSSSVYGHNEKIPFSENDMTDRPASLYAATKKSGELLAYSYHSLYNISMMGFRFFTVYGPWGRPDMAYFSFADAISEGRPITLYNEGRMARDFTYIDDITSALLAALNKDFPFEIFNLGNHHPETVLTLVECLEKALNLKAKKILSGPKKGELPITFADIAKAQKLLGFSPKTPLEEGISRFIEWHQHFRVKATL